MALMGLRGSLHINLLPGRRGANVVRVGIWKPGTWAEAGGSFSEPHGAALSLWLVLRLWLGRTGGWKSLPLSKCIPPPTMRAAALSHLLPVAGCICRAAGGCLWADDSVKLRSLSAAGSTSAVGAVRPVAASARIRAQLLPPLPSPPERSNPHAGEGAGVGVSYNGVHLPSSTTCLPVFSGMMFGVCRCTLLL